MRVERMRVEGMRVEQLPIFLSQVCNIRVGLHNLTKREILATDDVTASLARLKRIPGDCAGSWDTTTR